MALFFLLFFAYTVCEIYCTDFNYDFFPRILHLDVQVWQINDTYVYNFTCSSSRDSIGKSTEFTIDSKTEEHISYVGGKCLNRKAEECLVDNCQCFPNENSFMFSYVDEYPDPKREYGCQMRFVDLQTMEIIKAYMSVKINGTDVKPHEFDAKVIGNQKMENINETKETTTASYSASNVLWVPIGFSIFLVILIVLGVCCLKIQSCKKKCIYRHDREEETIELYTISENERGISSCGLCKSMSRHSLCVTCKQFYCVYCTDLHMKRKINHIITPLTQIGMIKSKQYCVKCKRKATQVCAKCRYLICNRRECKCVHAPKLFDMFLVDFGFTAPVSNNDINENHVNMELQHIVKLSAAEKTVRICGISLHSGDICTAVDSNNKDVAVYRGSRKLFSTVLPHEPRCMTKVSDDEIAITFPYEMKVLIYSILYNTITQTIETKSLGKPFSICYDESHFTIEIGEGVDGRVFILDGQGITKYEIHNSEHFALFTGNSVKLSLDMVKKRLFVSAIDKQVVSCVNFKGHILWNKGFPSTGDIVFIREMELDSEYILLSSEMDNMVYHVSSDDGSSRTLVNNQHIRSPQHIAYSNQLLAILTDDVCIKTFKDDSQVTTNKKRSSMQINRLIHYHLGSPSPLYES